MATVQIFNKLNVGSVDLVRNMFFTTTIIIIIIICKEKPIYNCKQQTYSKGEYDSIPIPVYDHLRTDAARYLMR